MVLCAGGVARPAAGAEPRHDWGRWGEESTHEFDPTLAYRRVDGAGIGGRYRFHSLKHDWPRLTAEAAYATARKRGLFGLEIAHSLLPGDRLDVSGSLSSRTTPFEFDREIVGELENTLAAALVRQDYREYYESRGGALGAAFHVTDKYTLSGGYAVEHIRPLDVIADWALFGGDTKFRDNPQVQAGTLRMMSVGLTHDSRPPESAGGTPFLTESRRSNRDWVRLTWQTSGGGLGGDFDFASVRLDARGYWKLAPQQFLSARLLAGRATRGRLPVERQFYAGGISTLRAHPFKAYRGDRLFLLNAEYAVDLVRASQALLFCDLGRAWFHELDPGGVRLPIDVGVGVQTRDERLRLLVARDTRRSGWPLLVSLRTNASF